MAENWRDFTFNDNRWLILKEKVTYYPTDSGKSFHRKPDEVKCEVVEPKHYENFITSIPFFNNWGNGAYCRGVRTYTGAGYLPTNITTVGPDHCERNVVKFRFISKWELEKNAGWREKEVMQKAKRYESERYVGKHGYSHERLTLVTEDTGVTASATFDFGQNRWVD